MLSLIELYLKILDFFANLISQDKLVNKNIDLNSNAKAVSDRIVYIALNNNYELCTVKSDGTGKKVLHKSEYKLNEPSWSPDNKYIVFSEDNIVGDAELYIIDAQGNNLQKLTNHRESLWGSTWSPDGKQIAYHCYGRLGWKIYILSLETKTTKMVKRSIRAMLYAAWAPDSKKIVFKYNVREKENDENWHLYSINIDGSDFKRITTPANVNCFPSWAPDGKKIAFWIQKDSIWELYSINPDGTEFKQITKNINLFSKSMCRASWSPNSDLLAISVSSDPDSVDLKIITPEGNLVSKLNLDDFYNFDPDWSNS